MWEMLPVCVDTAVGAEVASIGVVFTSKNNQISMEFLFLTKLHIAQRKQFWNDEGQKEILWVCLKTYSK